MAGTPYWVIKKGYELADKGLTDEEINAEIKRYKRELDNLDIDDYIDSLDN